MKHGLEKTRYFFNERNKIKHPEFPTDTNLKPMNRIKKVIYIKMLQHQKPSPPNNNNRIQKGIFFSNLFS